MRRRKTARQALFDGAPEPEVWNSLALTLGHYGRFAEAEDLLKKTIEVEPNNPIYLLNRANMAADQFHFDEAWSLFAKVRNLADVPMMRHNEGMARLLAGDYAKGWALNEARCEMGAAPKQMGCPRYRDGSLAGKKLLVVAEQGLGDTIHFCRFEKKMIEAGAQPIWAVQPSLVRLLRASLQGEVVNRDEPLPEADFYVPVLSLPYALKCYEPFGAGVYLRADEKQPLLPQAQGNKKIGLVWSGSPTHARDAERTVPLPFFKTLCDSLMDAHFYAPCVGKVVEEIKTSGVPMTDLSSLIHDFADTAALLKQMDVLVTVDTSIAHLAGALGVPTYVLLPACPDWRWGISGETTAWYPSMTLVRQTTWGDWQAPLVKVAQKIAAA